jgi:hypothetical protein
MMDAHGPSWPEPTVDAAVLVIILAYRDGAVLATRVSQRRTNVEQARSKREGGGLVVGIRTDIERWPVERAGRLSRVVGISASAHGEHAAVDPHAAILDPIPIPPHANARLYVRAIDIGLSTPVMADARPEGRTPVGDLPVGIPRVVIGTGCTTLPNSSGFPLYDQEITSRASFSCVFTADQTPHAGSAAARARAPCASRWPGSRSRRG